MKSYLSFILALSFLAAADAQNTSFSRISLDGSARVVLVYDTAYSWRPSSGDVRLSGNTLVIGGSPEDEVTVRMPFIGEIEINGHGIVTGEGTFPAKNARLTINGDGKINLALTAETVRAEIPGSGKITLSGTARDGYFSILGSGKIDASELRTITSRVRIDGVGKVEVDVIDDLDVIINGNGNVTFREPPKNLTEEINGIGKVRKARTNENEESNNTNDEIDKEDDSPDGKSDTTKIEIGESEVWVIGKKDNREEKKEKN